MPRLPLAALAAALAAAGALAPPAFARPVRAAATAATAAPLVVDVSRLRALGLGPSADLVQNTVVDELRSRPLPTSGRLVVRIDSLSLSAFAGPDGAGGGGGDGNGGGGNFDYMQGEGLVIGPGGEVLRRIPIVMSTPSSSGGPYYLPDVDQRRLMELSRNFARWVERGLG
jgi:hypothetical protein